MICYTLRKKTSIYGWIISIWSEEQRNIHFSSLLISSFQPLVLILMYDIISLKIIKDGRDKINFNVTIGPRVKYML